MKRFFDPSRLNFLILIPLVAKAFGSGDSLPAEDVHKVFVGNTVVVQLAEGPAYALVAPNGVARGLHPTEGRITGSYSISEDGIICVTWPLASGEVNNCDQVAKADDQKHSWAGKTLEVIQGDPRGLAK